MEGRGTHAGEDGPRLHRVKTAATQQNKNVRWPLQRSKSKAAKARTRTRASMMYLSPYVKKSALCEAAAAVEQKKDEDERQAARGVGGRRAGGEELKTGVSAAREVGGVGGWRWRGRRREVGVEDSCIVDEGCSRRWQEVEAKSDGQCAGNNKKDVVQREAQAVGDDRVEGRCGAAMNDKSECCCAACGMDGANRAWNCGGRKKSCCAATGASAMLLCKEASAPTPTA